MTVADPETPDFMQQNAAALIERYAGHTTPNSPQNGLDGIWDTLAVLPPSCKYLGLSVFTPRSSLQFLDEIAQGKTVQDVSNLALAGLDYRTHLNIQGRIAAGTAHYAQDGQAGEIIRRSLSHLDMFQHDFGNFVDAYRSRIVSGLQLRSSERPEAQQLDPSHLWQSRSTYGVSDNLLVAARFDQADRDLRVSHGFGPPDRFRTLQAEVSLPSPASTGGGLLASLIGRARHWREGMHLHH